MSMNPKPHILQFTDTHLAILNEGLMHVPFGRAAPVVNMINAQLAQPPAHYDLLAQIVRSDQLTHDQVHKLILSDEGFAQWYQEQVKANAR